MESFCICKVSRPSAKTGITGISLRGYTECCPDRDEAGRRAGEIHVRSSGEVEAVELVALDLGSGRLPGRRRRAGGVVINRRCSRLV
jgi:hypothetical protein